MFLFVNTQTIFYFDITGGQKNYGSKSSGLSDSNGRSKTAKKQTPVYNEKAMLLSSDEELP